MAKKGPPLEIKSKLIVAWLQHPHETPTGISRMVYGRKAGSSVMSARAVRKELEAQGLLTPPETPNVRAQIEEAYRLVREEGWKPMAAIMHVKLGSRWRYQRGIRLLELEKHMDSMTDEERERTHQSLTLLEEGNVTGAEALVRDLIQKVVGVGNPGGVGVAKRGVRRQEALNRAVYTVVQVCGQLDKVEMPLTIPRKEELEAALYRARQQLRHFSLKLTEVNDQGE